jgi:hypothetical protein
MARKSNFLNAFLVGCDPEVVCVDAAGNQVHVDRTITKDGQIGWDHGGRVMEFRPTPHKGTYTLVKDIKELITGAPAGIRKYRWLSGAYVKFPNEAGESLGGHVWLDLNPNSAIQSTRVKALDRLTESLERLDILPRQECIVRRRGKYGKFADVRTVQGDRPRFEYRTMASWMYNPATAFLCLTAAKMAAYDPEGAAKALKPEEASWKGLTEWLEGYAEDCNVARLSEKVFPKGLKKVQYHPDVDVKEAWAGKLGF